MNSIDMQTMDSYVQTTSYEDNQKPANTLGTDICVLDKDEIAQMEEDDKGWVGFELTF